MRHPLARAYHRLLVWDIMNRPALTRVAERALNPLVGKSLVVYAAKGQPPAQPPGLPQARTTHAVRRAGNRAALPAVPGILTADEILATGRSIAASQQRDGAVGWPDGHIDAWNHVECAMAVSVCGLPAPPGGPTSGCAAPSARTGPGQGETGGEVTDHAVESNHVAYVAVGVWHELQVTGDEAFALRMWPTVRRAIDFVLRLQTARGELVGARRRRHAGQLRPADRVLEHLPEPALRGGTRRVHR